MENKKIEEIYAIAIKYMDKFEFKERKQEEFLQYSVEYGFLNFHNITGKIIKKVKITKRAARFIKYMREKCNWGWRSVAGSFTELWLKDNEKFYTTNQLIGMELCSCAQELLKEKWENG